MENIKCEYFGDEKICENDEYYKNYCAFGKEPKGILKKFYNNELFRKSLEYKIKDSGEEITVILLNPSFACDKGLDLTLNNFKKFLLSVGNYSSFRVLNIFPIRTPKSSILSDLLKKNEFKKYQFENKQYILNEIAKSNKIVIAWGSKYNQEAISLLDELWKKKEKPSLLVYHLNKDGLKTVMLNMDAIGNNKHKLVETLMHELEHARQESKYQELNRKHSKTAEDRAFLRAYKECQEVNKAKEEFYKKHKKILAVALNNRIDKTNAEYNEYFNACTKYEKLVILNYAKLYDNYLNAEHEVQAREAGKDAVRRLQNATDTKRYGQYEPRRNQETFEPTGGLREERTLRTRPQSSDYEGWNQGDLEEGLDLKPTTTKERGAIETLNKYNKDMADAVTDREYEVRGLKKVSKEIESMSEKEIDDVLNGDRSTDVKSVALAQSIKSEIEKGNVPTSKLNKWAVEGTEIGQAMQARKAIAPETVEEAVIKMHTYNTEKAPQTARKLLNDSENIVKQIKQDIKNNPFKDEVSVFSGLSKAIQQEKEHKRKVVERLITERTFGLGRKKRADLIDNILKLEENDGLTADNVCKLICKMYKIKEVNKTDVEELKKLADDIKNAKTQRDEDVAKAKMQKYVIDNSIGSDIYNKIDTVRYINMLGGTAQRVLDFVSTGVYQVVRLADGTTTLILDKTLSKPLGVESVTNGFYTTEWAKGFAQGAKEGYYDTIHGIETGRAGETARYDLNKPLAFRYRPLKLKKGFLPKVGQGVENSFSVVEKFVNGMVKIPDRAYFAGRYNASLLEQMSARGINTKQFKKLGGNTLAETLTENATKEEIEQAIIEARENVFQRDCVASKMARNIRVALNYVHVGGFKLGDWAFPFIHTTSVISEDIVDRIGLGFIKGCNDIYRIKKLGGTKSELRNAYNSIAKSLVGAIIISVGAMRGAEDDEQTPAEKEMVGGHQKAMNVGDISYNAKDIPFVTVPFRLGKLLRTNDEHKIKKAILQTWDAIADTNPILSKYKESAQNNYRNKDEADILDQFISDTIGTTVGQLVQNSQLRNIRTITDPYERETYDPNSAINTQINRFKNSNPFTVIFREPFATIEKLVKLAKQGIAEIGFAEFKSAIISSKDLGTESIKKEPEGSDFNSSTCIKWWTFGDEPHTLGFS